MFYCIFSSKEDSSSTSEDSRLTIEIEASVIFIPLEILTLHLVGGVDKCGRFFCFLFLGDISIVGASGGFSEALSSCKCRVSLTLLSSSGCHSNFSSLSPTTLPLPSLIVYLVLTDNGVLGALATSLFLLFFFLEREVSSL